jgi:hypothetical protein
MVERKKDAEFIIAMKHYIEGDAQNVIATKAGFSEARISYFLKGLRENIPEIDDLVSINKAMKSIGLNLEEVRVGIPLAVEAKRLGMTTENMEQANRLIKKHKERASKVLDAGARLLDMEEEWGQSYENLLATAPLKKEEIDDLDLKLIAKRAEEQKLIDSLKELTKLRELDKELDRMAVSIGSMDSYVKRQRLMDREGLEYKTVKALVDELDKAKMSPEEAAKELVKLIVKGKTLRESILVLVDIEEDLKKSIKEKGGCLAEVNKGLENAGKLLEGIKQDNLEEERSHAIEVERLVSEKNGLNLELSKMREELSKMREDVKKTEDATDQELRAMDKEVAKRRHVLALATLMEPDKKILDKKTSLEAFLILLDCARTSLFPDKNYNDPTVGYINSLKSSTVEELRGVK